MNWEEVPKELKIVSFKDFCIRREEIYDAFWELFAPFNDIIAYRDYILFDIHLSSSKYRQETLAGKIWEYLMGDILDEELIDFWIHLKPSYTK